MFAAFGIAQLAHTIYISGGALKHIHYDRTGSSQNFSSCPASSRSLFHALQLQCIKTISHEVHFSTNSAHEAVSVLGKTSLYVNFVSVQGVSGDIEHLLHTSRRLQVLFFSLYFQWLRDDSCTSGWLNCCTVGYDWVNVTKGRLFGFLHGDYIKEATRHKNSGRFKKRTPQGNATHCRVAAHER